MPCLELRRRTSPKPPKSLDFLLDLAAIAYMWGDISTKTLQPFWVLPLLAICGMSYRQIMGFLIVFGLTSLVITSVALLAAPAFFQG
ncbi:TIGR00366 family protein [Paenarthrobacter sp. NPDC089675]|uniref:TIGR00366 family protein n=1 Tax=Paenarthrobacter sp. NPDC089675 TaxID=3364376 RepID=UPI0038137239